MPKGFRRSSGLQEFRHAWSAWYCPLLVAAAEMELAFRHIQCHCKLMEEREPQQPLDAGGRIRHIVDRRLTIADLCLADPDGIDPDDIGLDRPSCGLQRDGCPTLFREDSEVAGYRIGQDRVRGARVQDQPGLATAIDLGLDNQETAGTLNRDSDLPGWSW